MTAPTLTAATNHHVYQPQHDSRLLADALVAAGLVRNARVADLCTGSGVLAVEAARGGASYVAAFDLSDRAVACTRENAVAAGVEIEVFQRSFADAAAHGPFDVVTCNPPYVPRPDDAPDSALPDCAGPPLAYDAGPDGRLVLDPLCAAAPDLLDDGGSMFIVHSELAGIDASLVGLRESGLKASVVARQWIPFGPVLTARTEWLERTGRIATGRRIEQLVVIRADVP